MSSKLLKFFREIVVADSEFRTIGNGLVAVRCVCAWELHSGRQHRIWIAGRERCPYPLGPHTLFVAHYASAEIISHVSLRWPLPMNVLDTCIEFSSFRSGLRGKGEKRGLLDALKYFHHKDSLSVEAKDELRQLAMANKRNEEYTTEERKALLNYCWLDVAATKSLLLELEPHLCGNYREI